MKIKPLLISLFLVLLTSCSSGVDNIEQPSQVCRKVEMFGDSITHQAGQTIEQYLPCYTVVNHGSDGTMARDMVLPVWDKDTIYTISYGVNECLGQVSAAEYGLALNHILTLANGYKVVIEAPWRVVDPRCSANIEQYRTVAVQLGATHGFPVAIEDNQDHIGEGIHLPQAHMQVRAKILADLIKGLK